MSYMSLVHEFLKSVIDVFLKLHSENGAILLGGEAFCILSSSKRAEDPEWQKNFHDSDTNLDLSLEILALVFRVQIVLHERVQISKDCIEPN